MSHWRDIIEEFITINSGSDEDNQTLSPPGQKRPSKKDKKFSKQIENQNIIIQDLEKKLRAAEDELVNSQIFILRTLSLQRKIDELEAGII